MATNGSQVQVVDRWRHKGVLEEEANALEGIRVMTHFVSHSHLLQPCNVVSMSTGTHGLHGLHALRALMHLCIYAFMHSCASLIRQTHHRACAKQAIVHIQPSCPGMSEHPGSFVLTESAAGDMAE